MLTQLGGVPARLRLGHARLAIVWHSWRLRRGVARVVRPSLLTRLGLVLRFRRQLTHLEGTVALWGLMLGMDEYAEDEEGER